jgi:hypothetical protein
MVTDLHLPGDVLTTLDDLLVASDLEELTGNNLVPALVCRALVKQISSPRVNPIRPIAPAKQNP